MIKIYTDGGCQPNPGVGGYAAIVLFPDGRRFEKCGGFKMTTNNRMEVYAAIAGLESIVNEDDRDVIIYSDSQYLVNTMEKNWKRRINRDLWAVIDHFVSRFDSVRFQWVRGHNGDINNEMCDMLAQDEMSRDDLSFDDGYTGQ